MKQIKKLASLLLAAVLAMTLLAGCGSRGGNVSTAVTEQSILKFINEIRAKADKGLSPVKNDPELANAAAELLEAFSETEMVKVYYGTGYKLSKTQVKNILNTATGRNDQDLLGASTGVSNKKRFFSVAPEEFGYSSGQDFYLLRRANKFIDSDNYSNYNQNGTAGDFAPSWLAMADNVKVGIAFREINGERFALVVYDVTNPEITS